LTRYKELKLNPPLDVDISTCTWEDIFAHMGSVRSEYEEQARGIKGIFHKLWRSAGGTADFVTPFFDLVPDDYGLQVLKAGFTIFFTVSMGVRDMVLEPNPATHV
jgi:hypothetical protein